MSFSSDARVELTQQVCRWDCCARSEMTAFLLCSGGISFQGMGRYGVSFPTEDAAVARYCFSLMKKFFGVTGEIRTIRTSRLGDHMSYQLAVNAESSKPFLQELGLLDSRELFGIRTVPTPETVEKECCKLAFLKAAFLTCGTVSNPERAYHFEIACANESLADFVMSLINYFGLCAKKTCRKSQFVVYLKNSERIAEMLTHLGASTAVLAFENTLIMKGLKNQVNRQMNCDSNNIQRVMDTAETQLEDIHLIEEEIGLEKLPKALRDIAIIRLNNSATSLSGLGEMLDKPIGKSGVNKRLKKIHEIAENLRTGEEVHL